MRDFSEKDLKDIFKAAWLAGSLYGKTLQRIH